MDKLKSRWVAAVCQDMNKDTWMPQWMMKQTFGCQLQGKQTQLSHNMQSFLKSHVYDTLHGSQI